MFKKLTPGDTVGIMAPAYIPDRDRLERGLSYLRSRGYRIRTGRSLSARHGYFAGTDELRIGDLHDLYEDPDVRAIICARGGWGGLRLIDRLDYELIAGNPKPVIGYSDVTTLQLAVWQKTGIPGLSGPMAAVEMGKGILPFTETHFWSYVEGGSDWHIIDLGSENVSVMRGGSSEGTLLGGCLSMLSGLLGTPYSPDYRDKILFFEDIGESPYRIDRYLAQLRQAGVFAGIRGLIIGEFIDCEPEKNDKSFTVSEILADYFNNSPFPVLSGFPYGHGDRKISMPIGVTARLDTGEATLKIQNPFEN